MEAAHPLAASAVLVDPDTIRQVFNDTDQEQLWLIVGAPPEAANTLEMTAEKLDFLYPDGPKALPPELELAASSARRPTHRTAASPVGRRFPER
jgi:hypothetical protein